MKFRSVTLSIFFCLYTYFSNAQNKGTSAFDRAQSIFVEFKGSGVNLTLNYDTRFQKKVNGLGGKIGIGYFGDRYQSSLNIPVELNYLFGKTNHFFEAGAGIVWGNYIVNSVDQKGFADFYITPLDGLGFNINAGYRYQKPSGIILKLNFTPLFTKAKIYPLAGISCGYSF